MAMFEVDQICQIMTWIGFADDNERGDVIVDATTTYNDIRCLSINDITAIVSNFGGMIVLNGRVRFGS